VKLPPSAAMASVNVSWFLLLLIVLAFLPQASAQRSAWDFTVKSTEGHPLKECIVTPVLGVPDDASTQLTNGFGKARIMTVSDEVVIVRCPGYRSQLLQRESSDEIETQLTLEKAVGPIRPCKRSERKHCIGSYQSFCIPKKQGYRVRCGSDIDYSTCSYCRQTDGKDVCVSHGAGILWSLGFPGADLIGGSREYDEEVYTPGRGWITDARGYNIKGSWRFIGMLGETITYRNVTSTAKEELDSLLDGICLYEQ